MFILREKLLFPCHLLKGRVSGDFSDKSCRDKYSVFTGLASAAQGTNQWDVGTAAGQKVPETSKGFLLLLSMLEDAKRGESPSKQKAKKKRDIVPLKLLLFSFPLVNSSYCTLVEEFPSLFSRLKKYTRSCLGCLGWKMDFVTPSNTAFPLASIVCRIPDLRGRECP